MQWSSEGEGRGAYARRAIIMARREGSEGVYLSVHADKGGSACGSHSNPCT